MQITFVTRKFRNVERNLHCDVLHITTIRVARLVLDCNGVFAIKAYMAILISVTQYSCTLKKSILTTAWPIIFLNKYMHSTKINTCIYPGSLFDDLQSKQKSKIKKKYICLMKYQHFQCKNCFEHIIFSFYVYFNKH